jgi:serine/threonine-protein kinase
MAPPDPPPKSKPAQALPTDLLPLLQKSGILAEKPFQDLKARVLRGDLPFEPRELASRLIKEGILTEYQARRLLAGKAHGLSFGKYVILDRIGSGSMGRVYKAQHILMGRTVALKIIAPEVVTNPRIVSRFQREMKLVGRLDHPNVIRAFDADRIGDQLYIVMEYIPGMSLGQKFRSRGPMPAPDVVNYAAQAALGLGHAHSQGVVHRDVKPSNLLLTDDGQIKILDLGLGALTEQDANATFATQDGIAVGTVDYMSPEQARGLDVTGQSDIYGLGATMYHLISGQLPFPGANPIERLGKRISESPQPLIELVPDLPAGLPMVLDKMMANKPQDRYATAEEAADALRACIGLPPIPHRKPGESRVDLSPLTLAASGLAHMPVANAVIPTAPQVVEREVEVEVGPDYPGWFVPLAELAESNPAAALVTVVSLALLCGVAGFLAGWLLMPR